MFPGWPFSFPAQSSISYPQFLHLLDRSHAREKWNRNVLAQEGRKKVQVDSLEHIVYMILERLEKQVDSSL